MRFIHLKSYRILYIQSCAVTLLAGLAGSCGPCGEAQSSYEYSLEFEIIKIYTIDNHFRYLDIDPSDVFIEVAVLDLTRTSSDHVKNVI